MSSTLTHPAPVTTEPKPQMPLAPPIEPKQRAPWKWLILAGFLLAGGVAYWLFTRSQQASQATVTQVRTVAVTSGTLEVTSRVPGQTAARNFANTTAPLLRSPEGGRQMQLMQLASSGSFVKKGDVIAQMDPTNYTDHIDEVKDQVNQAELDVNKRKAEQALNWENLQQTLRVAKSELDKARLDASASEIRTVVDRELIKLAVEEAEARYKQLQADLSSQRIVHDAELKILEITRQRQVRHLNRHQEDLARLTIRARMNGLVVMQQIFRAGEMAQIQEGDQVYPGQLFMKVVDTSSMQVEGLVNQAESSNFRVGQRVRIRLDAFPGLEFDGTVTNIGAIAAGGWRNSFYIRNVPIRISIVGTDPRLIPDLSASAEVVLQRVENAAIAPLFAVKYEGNQAVVYVKKGEGFERRPVELGLANATHVALKSSVKPGEQLRAN